MRDALLVHERARSIVVVDGLPSPRMVDHDPKRRSQRAAQVERIGNEPTAPALRRLEAIERVMPRRA